MDELPQDAVEYYQSVERECKEEVRAADPVVTNIGYRSFTSRSKGIRNGKRRVRRSWKEVELIRYRSGWHYPHRSRLDEVATEVTKGQLGDDALLCYIREHCNH